MAERAVITLDIGKTHAKLTLWDCAGVAIARQSRANARCDDLLDAAGIEAWLGETLREFAALAEVGAIIPVAHGAAAVLIDGGKLVCPPRDYEAPIPAETRAEYDRLRAPFAETGSPALPDGLNLGAQLYAQRDAINGQILLWPQYWSWLLSGVAASEVTSLGCHTDLWNPAAGTFSTLAVTMGWAERFPPLRHAGAVLGPITPDWAVRTGLPGTCQIHCGVHDSNAALVAARGFAEIAGQEATVLSTGTWFIAMRSTAAPLAALSEHRDCLVNVDVDGRPTSSARFMGGREIELLGQRIDLAEDQPAMLAALPQVLASGSMILPTFAPGCGPFPERAGEWLGQPEDVHQQRATIALYVALMADTALDLIGAHLVLLIEGRFAASELFVRALAALRPETAVATTTAEADVSFGALRLVDPSRRPSATLSRVTPLAQDLQGYKALWQQTILQGSTA